jgi:hypothetical protein
LAWSLFKREQKPPPKDLEAFLCEHYWLKREQPTGCPDVFAALRIAGADCFDFMQELSEFFGIDLRAYDWSKYHFSEGEEIFDPTFGMFQALRRMLGKASREPNPRRLVYPISMMHLEKIHREKRWSDPDPMPPPRSSRVSRLFNRSSS